MRLHQAAGKDLLLRGLGLADSFDAHVCHSQAVLELPPGARRLASSELDENQAFVVGKRVWGLQFHPEFDSEILRCYIEKFRQELAEAGIDPEESLGSVQDAPFGPGILTRFQQMIKDYDNRRQLSYNRSLRAKPAG